MEYWLEACFILFAVVFPLSCVIWFLKELISGIDPVTIDSQDDNQKMD